MKDSALVLLVRPDSVDALPPDRVHAALSADLGQRGFTYENGSETKFKQGAGGTLELPVAGTSAVQNAQRILRRCGWQIVRTILQSDWENRLWTAEQAASYWGVSASRARAILADRNIKRVSGYSAEQIKQVELRQGARTDLQH
ncbi:hypothetical protein ACH4YO_37975 [Streptomyces noursei]|uniref:hypothetical protein n=1 Tax=Streptomyces noursei TaxID=1971 RepID=UPI00081C9B21|nr:hypothetical protein SNOUR_00405 [Streptomyces noursei ATCC 11455]ANZ21931.1 hypothetical protein SNOUR_43545 [Streptomyces noursei ATCC 11455]MCZ0996526.1 hypothetical protein [Streptomyces noursei]